MKVNKDGVEKNLLAFRKQKCVRLGVKFLNFRLKLMFARLREVRNVAACQRTEGDSHRSCCNRKLVGTWSPKKIRDRVTQVSFFSYINILFRLT